MSSLQKGLLGAFDLPRPSLTFRDSAPIIIFHNTLVIAISSTYHKLWWLIHFLVPSTVCLLHWDISSQRTMCVSLIAMSLASSTVQAVDSCWTKEVGRHCSMLWAQFRHMVAKGRRREKPSHLVVVCKLDTTPQGDFASLSPSHRWSNSGGRGKLPSGRGKIQNEDKMKWQMKSARNYQMFHLTSIVFPWGKGGQECWGERMMICLDFTSSWVAQSPEIWNACLFPSLDPFLPHQMNYGQNMCLKHNQVAEGRGLEKDPGFWKASEPFWCPEDKCGCFPSPGKKHRAQMLDAGLLRTCGPRRIRTSSLSGNTAETLGSWKMTSGG